MASLIGSGNVTNPMSSDLLANGFNITGAATYSGVRAEAQTLAVPAGSGLTEVVCEDNLLIEGGQALLFGAPGVGTASIKIEGDPGRDVILGPIPAGSVANVIGYDTATNKLYYQAAGGGSIPPNITVSSIAGSNSLNVTTQSNGNIWLSANGTGNTIVTTAMDMRSNVIYNINALTGQNGSYIDYTSDLLVAGGANVVNVTTSSNITMSADNIDLSPTTLIMPSPADAVGYAQFAQGKTLLLRKDGGGSANPILTLTNASTIAGSVFIESYKNKNIAAGDNLFAVGVFGNRTSGAKLELGRIETTVNDATLNSEDTRMSFYVRDDGAFPATGLAQLEIHGNEGQINMRLPLDMNVQDVLDLNRLSLNGKTSFGNWGQIVGTRASTASLLWMNPSQTSPVSVYGGGTTIDDTTPAYFGASFPSPNFPNSTTPGSLGRYKVEISIAMEGVNQNLICWTRLVYATTEYIGDIYRNPALGGGYVPYVSQPVTKAGTTYHTITYTDYVTFPYTQFNTTNNLEVLVGILTESGSYSTSDVKAVVTLSPVFA